MDSLSILFASEARVKMMRLFLLNQNANFDVEMISRKSKVNPKIVRKEISLLEKSDFAKAKVFYKIVQKKKRGKLIETKVKSNGYCLNTSFQYLSALEQLLIKTKTLDTALVLKKLSKAGKLTLVIVSGIFIQNKDSRVDMLVVGNNISKASFANIIGSIEAELGRELVYAYFETPDFQYRRGMYDKLIRDVLDYPHEVLLDKISL